MSEHRVNPELLHRTAWGNPVWNALQSLNIYGFCLVASLVASFIWPLALPACLLFTLITMLVFSLQRWRCPLRMPMTLECADPSQDRMIKRSLFSFWPTLFQYEVILESPASGIFYVGYQRVRDIGRELWLSMDDLTRHIMFFATTGGGKTETIFAWAINPLCWARGFTLVDGKAQNDTARTIWYLARRFGREDDVEVINFMNGGKSRSEIILSGEKTRPQSNTWNPFCYSTEAFTAETMQSMLRYPSYNTIVGSGENGCILHYTENECEMRDGDLVLIDAGCEYKGYAGDITRTFPVNGKFTQAQREIYDIVLESLETSLRLYRPGTSMQEVTGEVVRIMVSGLVKLGILKGDVDELIAQNAHRPFFMHGLSHWLGLDVHDVGVYGQDRSRILEPGMVLTVEPGLYIAPDADVPEQYRGIGIRIEDDIVITETGNENLTASVVKKPEEIEALMAAARKQ